MSRKDKLQAKWRALLAAIVAVVVISLGIVISSAGTNDEAEQAEQACLTATEQFEVSEITLAEFYDACKDIIENLEPFNPTDGKLPKDAV